jgi:dTDP-4-amino-4,6-dideoxygalactose transaminase
MSAVRKEYLAFGKPDFGDAEIEAVTRVMRSGWVGMGPEVIALERELQDYLCAPHVVTVNTCTSALFLSLLAHGVGAGDEVVCPSLTWCSTANAALYLGAKPVFCDVDGDTFCATPAAVKAALTARTRAVIVVHFGGCAADIDAIRAVLPPGVALIEDAAHALGGRYAGGAMVGSSGNLSCFSFYANKNLSTGEGGAISLRDAAMADRIRSLRLHALPIDAWKRYTNPKSLLLSNKLTELGYKMNFTDLQACIGRVQLRRQPELSARRLAIAQRYVERLSGVQGLRIQAHSTTPHHARHLFLVQLPLERMRMDRDDFVLEMRARNIGASIHYAPLHQMPLYGATGLRLPVTEDLARRIVTLPISASMSVEDAGYVVDCIEELLS